MKISLGPSGSPGKSTLEGIPLVAEMGLDALELSFTHGVHMSVETAKAVGKEAERCGVALSIHAPYYINLSSPELPKVKASMERILATAERMEAMGGGAVVFHPGYYGKSEPEACYEAVRARVEEMMGECERKGWGRVVLAPETTGRVAQFGTLEETLRLVRELGCGWCIDFCHLYAREQGKLEYGKVFDTIERFKQRELHVQFSGVTWNKGGEKAHTAMGDNPPFEPMARELLERGISARIISESPLRWEDSLKQKRVLEKLGWRF